MKVLILTSLILLTFAGNSFAVRGESKQLIKLNYFGEQFRGKTTLKLKRKIKEEIGLNLSNKQIVSVVVVGKSNRGRGSVKLRVGQAVTTPKTISGRPGNFAIERVDSRQTSGRGRGVGRDSTVGRDRAPGRGAEPGRGNDPGRRGRGSRRNTYYRVGLANPNSRMQSTGPWQLLLRGNIKIKKVLVTIKQKRRHRVELDFAGQRYRGDNTLYLKRALLEQYPSFRFRGKQLKKVILFAKSRRGMGSATLKVGDDLSVAEIVDGNRREFRIDEPYTFYKLIFQNPSYDSRGVWQILLKGNIKVSKVILKFKRGGSDDIDFYFNEEPASGRITL